MTNYDGSKDDASVFPRHLRRRGFELSKVGEIVSARICHGHREQGETPR